MCFFIQKSLEGFQTFLSGSSFHLVFDRQRRAPELACKAIRRPWCSKCYRWWCQTPMSQMTPSPICLALFTALRQEAPPKRLLRHIRCRLPFGEECLQFKPVNQSTGSMILHLTCSITIPLSPGSLMRHWTLKMLIAGLGFFALVLIVGFATL